MKGKWGDAFASLVVVAGVVWLVLMACGVDIGWPA